ncbi:MAG: protein kinase [Gammaproteobacteria bacterium]|nr:protein kinase [Gammaproteobacteria bacterium]
MAMGMVYLGHDPFANLPVALKVANHHSLQQSDQRKIYQRLFFNELHTASRLHHPYITHVYDAGIEDGSYYIAMEYVEGDGSLEKYCRPDNRLPTETIAEIIFQCAEALDYAHLKGVIHRDIKPENILRQHTGKVKLVDFGIALLVDPSLSDTQLMETMGSPLYMSPEQLLEESLTHQTDLFSLGVVMYELLAGRHPFATNSLASLTYKVIHEEPPPIREFHPNLPQPLEKIIQRMLAKDLTQRYRSAMDLAADLSMSFGNMHLPRNGMETEQRVSLLKQLTFFCEFPDAEIWELLRWAEWQNYPDGEIIIREGEEDDAFFIITSGTVIVCKNEKELIVLKKGDFFGEISYLIKYKRTATIKAQKNVSVLVLNAETIERTSESCQIRFQKEFIRTLINRLVNTTELLARSGFKRSDS